MIMRTFTLVNFGTPTEIGGIDLCSLEFTAIVQSINHLAYFLTTNTRLKMLITTRIKFHQLEIDIEFFLTTSYSNLAQLATSAWKTRL